MIEEFVLHMMLSLVQMVVKNPQRKQQFAHQMFEVWSAVGEAYADDPNFK